MCFYEALLIKPQREEVEKSLQQALQEMESDVSIYWHISLIISALLFFFRVALYVLCCVVLCDNHPV
jgi:hypothetical protein